MLVYGTIWRLGGFCRTSRRGRRQTIRRPATSAAAYRAIGCFPPGVKITMADGSLRNIEDVRAGDLVRNAKTGAPVKVGKVIEGPEALPLIRFGFDGTTVTTSQAHPVLTAAGLKPANQLKKGDTVFDAQGNPHALTILETLPLEEGQRVINVNLDAASSDAERATDSLRWHHYRGHRAPGLAEGAEIDPRRASGALAALGPASSWRTAAAPSAAPNFLCSQLSTRLLTLADRRSRRQLESNRRRGAAVSLRTPTHCRSHARAPTRSSSHSVPLRIPARHKSC